MEKLEKVKTRFIKRVIRASKQAPNRMVYMLGRETFFLEDIMLLPATEPYKEVIARRIER